ncbi:MAG: trk system potassium uptake protein TrkH [Myxococcota bacterium]
MNLRRVSRIVGLVLYALAGAQIVPLLLCFFPVDAQSAKGFLAGIVSSAVLGSVLRRVGDEEGELYRREGVLVVVGAWLLASVFGAVPFLVSGTIAHPVDALFESASGFTTTGASILQNIEAVPAPLLFWRSMTQWLGGIGIVVLFVALLSELGPGARFLFKLEVPGPKAEILHSRVRQTAAALFRIYLVLTLMQIIVMLLCGASLYDSVVHAFSTVSTGGFSPYNDSVAHLSSLLQTVILVFMLVSGVNFALYYAFAKRRDWVVLRDVELRAYAVIVGVVSMFVCADLVVNDSEGSRAKQLLDAAFQVVSLITTTGFSTDDFAQWPGLSHAFLLALMFVGGCAGSTAGGAKVIRMLIGFRVAMREVRLTYSPNSVIAISVGNQVVPEASVRAVVALLLLWFLGWGTGALLLSVGDTDIVTAVTASLATLSNIGPGLAAVGPNENFAFFAHWQKLVMVVLMWLGRLEFFALLALAQPQFWRR